MQMPVALHRAAPGFVLAAVLTVLAGAAGRSAAGEERAAPERGEDIKPLLERALSGWDDASERQAILREIHDLFAWRLDQLQALMRQNLDEAHDAAEQLVEQASHMIDMKRDRPQEYERAARLVRLEGETYALARKAREAPVPAREAAIAEMKKKLAESFDAKQESMKRDLATMEAETENLRRRVGKRAENRDRLIERRALDLLGDNDVEW